MCQWRFFLFWNLVLGKIILSWRVAAANYFKFLSLSESWLWFSRKTIDMNASWPACSINWFQRNRISGRMASALSFLCIMHQNIRRRVGWHQNGSAAKTYPDTHLQYYSDCLTWCYYLQVLLTEDMSIQLQGLLPFTSYTLKVRCASNSLKDDKQALWSNYSVIQYRTEPDGLFV